MKWYYWVAIIPPVLACITCLRLIIRLVTPGRPEDFSVPAGNISESIRYAYTSSMNPARKETAFLHLPTYAAGIIYHAGTFLSLIFFPFIWLQLSPSEPVIFITSIVLVSSALCGIGILIKRMTNSRMRKLSNPDDYISNILVTGFQVTTVIVLNFSSAYFTYFIVSGLLFLYFPVGKLKHAVYFFAARYHLGLFFGRRGVWPPVNEK
ncbi:MAG: hypothetical protein NTW49_00405 [Bacteroidia bacterium]|nr:hypothetical protein [Bacteroidia bacterium]